jgi:hypothetical protein
VTVDTLFRIMPMTKMPCTVAALQQVEQGNLDLDTRSRLRAGALRVAVEGCLVARNRDDVARVQEAKLVT